MKTASQSRRYVCKWSPAEHVKCETACQNITLSRRATEECIFPEALPSNCIASETSTMSSKRGSETGIEQTKISVVSFLWWESRGVVASITASSEQFCTILSTLATLTNFCFMPCVCIFHLPPLPAPFPITLCLCNLWAGACPLGQMHSSRRRQALHSYCEVQWEFPS